jgi:hypothetical protein
MSHITTVKTTIALKNEAMIKTALMSMAKQFSGLTFEQTAPDVIKVRYAAIEGYQKNGNIQFIKNDAGVWEMQLDTWRCESEVNKVRDAFFQEYRQAAVMSYLGMAGYMCNTAKNGKNIVLTATKY